MPRVTVLHEDDNIAVALDPLAPENIVNVPGKGQLKVMEHIPFAHKIALQDIPKGQLICKYGSPIAKTTQDIAQGSHVHIHNVVSLRKTKSS